MLTAPATFSNTDVATHRVLRAYGKDLQWWNEQSDDDRFEYLAADRWRQDRLDQLRSIFDKKIEDKEGIDIAAYFALLTAQL